MERREIFHCMPCMLFLEGEAEEEGRDISSIINMEYHIKRQTQ